MLMCEPFSGSSHAVKLLGRAQLAFVPGHRQKEAPPASPPLFLECGARFFTCS